MRGDGEGCRAERHRRDLPCEKQLDRGSHRREDGNDPEHAQGREDDAHDIERNRLRHAEQDRAVQPLDQS